MRVETFRQFLVITGLGFSSITDGFIFGQMSGMIDSLHRNKESIPLTEDDLSWIASIINVTCFCGFAVVGVLAEILGRKRTIAIVTSPVIIYWIIIYYGENKITFLLSRVLIGFCYGGILLLIHVSIGEYIPPTIRPLFLNVISCIGSSTGTLLGHILSILINWRIVALIGIIPTTVSAILPCFWQESPSWLATKGRFKECEKAFKALHIWTKLSDNELRLLVTMEKQKLSNNTETTFSYRRKVISACKQKYFWKIYILGIVTNLYRVASGRILFGTLAITMLREITGRPDILYFTFFVDGFAVLGAFVSCVLLPRFKTRSLLFSLGVVANVILLLLAIFLYSCPANNSYIAWTKVSLLAFYFVTVTSGPYPILETILTEIFPLDIKAFCFLGQGIICGIFQFLSIKLAPNMFNMFGYHGLFLLHSVIIVFCLIYLWYFLPETKSRSLHEIEHYFRYNTFNVAKIINSEENEANLLETHHI